MKLFHKFTLCLLLLMVPLFVFGCAGGTQPEGQQQAQDQGQQDKQEDKQQQTGEAEFVSSAEKPEACGTCHVKVSDEKDYSLSAEVKQIENHPQVEGNTAGDCIGCHREGENGFSTIMHKHHYKKGENSFVANYKGSCVHCHKLTAEGELPVPGLAPEGTTYETIEVAQVDKAPGGCQDCHKKISDEKDYSLPTEVGQIPNHPAVESNDFNDCYTCHQSGENSFDRILHRHHLKGEKYREYGNSCLNCHEVAENGTITLKGKK